MTGPPGERHTRRRSCARRASIPVAHRRQEVPVKSFAPQLRIPGPTPLPDAVREAGARQMINHRGPEFAALLARCTEGLQGAMATKNDIVFLTASGTGGLEAAVVNHLSPGDAVLAVSIGSFGGRLPRSAATDRAGGTKT